MTFLDKNFRNHRHENTNIWVWKEEEEGKEMNINYELFVGNENERGCGKCYISQNVWIIIGERMEEISLGNWRREKTENVYITGMIVSGKKRRRTGKGNWVGGDSQSAVHIMDGILPANGIIVTWHAFKEILMERG